MKYNMKIYNNYNDNRYDYDITLCYYTIELFHLICML